MNPKYGLLHEHILCLLHSLVFEEYGLKGDAKERLLRKWYEIYVSQTEEIIETILKQDKEREERIKKLCQEALGGEK